MKLRSLPLFRTSVIIIIIITVRRLFVGKLSGMTPYHRPQLEIDQSTPPTSQDDDTKAHRDVRDSYLVHHIRLSAAGTSPFSNTLSVDNLDKFHSST